MAAMVKQEYPEPSALQEILPDNQLGLEEYMDSADAATQPAILEDGRSIEESGAVETPNLENIEPKISPTDGDQKVGFSPPKPVETPEPSPAKDVPEPSASEVPVSAVKVPESSALPPSDPPVPEQVDNSHQVRKRPLGDDAKEHDYYETKSIPPLVLSPMAIYCRMRRVFQKRKDGTMVLGDQWNDMWNDVSGGRIELQSMFEKVGYNVDRVCQTLCFQRWSFFRRSLYPKRRLNKIEK